MKAENRREDEGFLVGSSPFVCMPGLYKGKGEGNGGEEEIA